MSTKQTEALKLALEALEKHAELGLLAGATITAIREALAQPEYTSEADTEELLKLNDLPEPLRLAAMLEKTMQWPLHGKAADCLRKMHAALEQPAQQQEPVAVYVGETWCGSVVRLYDDLPLETPLYTSQPASKPWVGLTDQEIRDWWRIENGLEDCNMAKLVDFTLAVRAIEAKLREKNA